MGLQGALLLFSIFIAIYIVIIEIFTVLFRLTGLTEQKARFQVISMLTNSGFTTTESEIITGAKRRRKLASATMIFGYSFSVIIVSSVVNIFLSLQGAALENIQSTFIMVGVICLIFSAIFRKGWVKKKFDEQIERIGTKIMFGEHANAVFLLDTYGDQVIAQVKLFEVPELLQGKTLYQSGIKENYGIMVMLLKRGINQAVMVGADTMFEQEDIIVLFGEYKAIREVFANPNK